MTPEISSALPTLARIPSEATPQSTSDATANEAGLRDAPGSSRGSSGWSLTEPTDGAVHGVPIDGPARHRSTTQVEFWEEQALRLDWAEPWHTAHRRVPADLDAGTGPDITWFEGGKLNVSYNCVDRHVAAGRGDKVALHFEGEPGDRRAITYAELQREVAKAANALQL